MAMAFQSLAARLAPRLHWARSRHQRRVEGPGRQPRDQSATTRQALLQYRERRTRVPLGFPQRVQLLRLEHSHQRAIQVPAGAALRGACFPAWHRRHLHVAPPPLARHRRPLRLYRVTQSFNRRQYLQLNLLVPQSAQHLVALLLSVAGPRRARRPLLQFHRLPPLLHQEKRINVRATSRYETIRAELGQPLSRTEPGKHYAQQ